MIEEQQDPVGDLIAARRKALQDSGASPSQGATSGGNIDSLIAERRKALGVAGPGVVSRGLSALGAGLTHAIEHPIDTAEQMIVQPIKSAFTATVAPGVGEARPDARLSKGGNSSGRPIDTSAYDAEHGGVTNRERTAAGVQTVANIVAPKIFSGVQGAAAKKVGGKLATAAGLAASGGAEGAAYNPDDPAAGAVAGAVGSAAIGSTVAGAVRGADAARNIGGKAQRARAALPLDEAVVARNAATKAADIENYGRAQAEGEANGGTSPALTDALAHPRVKPFAEKFRASDRGQNATDAAVAQATYKLMSKQRRGIQERMAREGYNADLDLEADNLKGAMQHLKAATASESERPPITMDVAPEVFERDAKITQAERATMDGPVGTGPLSARTTPANPTLSQGLRNFHGETPNAVQGPDGPAFQMRGQSEKVQPGVRIETPAMRVQTAPAEPVPAVMPSFPGAVAEHARMAGNRQAFNTAADATKRIMRGTSVPAKKLDTQSPAAFREIIGSMTPEEAKAALQGTLGRAKEQMSGVKLLEPKKGFGVGQNIVGLKRISPFVDALDKQAGNVSFTPTDLESILRYIGVASAPLTNQK